MLKRLSLFVFINERFANKEMDIQTANQTDKETSKSVRSFCTSKGERYTCVYSCHLHRNLYLRIEVRPGKGG